MSSVLLLASLVLSLLLLASLASFVSSVLLLASLVSFVSSVLLLASLASFVSSVLLLRRYYKRSLHTFGQYDSRCQSYIALARQK